MGARIWGLVAAVLLHGLVLLFGGLFFSREEPENDRRRIEDVDLVSEEAPEGEEKAEHPEAEADSPDEEVLHAETEAPPDMRALLEAQPRDPSPPPALDALSLSALETILSPDPGPGDLDGIASLVSGGRIGGSGLPGSPEEVGFGDAVFGLTELDQRPRPLFQAKPVYPAEMRRRKADGTVFVLFVVDPEGKVVNPRVERSTDQAFEKAALDAVRQWRFEPATRNGSKVHCRMRVPIRFSWEG